MLENIIRQLSKKIVLAATGIALNLSCGPSLTVPTQVPGANGYVATGKDCCEQLDCSKHDGCRSEGEKYNSQTGNYEESCKCYDKSTPSSPEPHYKDGPGHVPGGDGPGGHWEKPGC